MSDTRGEGDEGAKAAPPPTTLTDPTPAGESPAFLYVEKGPGAGQLVPLRQGTLVIGRGSGADLRLVHASISRKHAAVTRDGDQFFVRDFGSQNGTFVNQLRSPQEMELFPGDELAIGNAVLRLRSRADQDDLPVSGRVTTGMWLSGVSRSSSGLLMLVLAAAISLGLVVALGWALLSGPTSPTMEPVAVAPAPAPSGKAPAPASAHVPEPAAAPAPSAQDAAAREAEAHRAAEAALEAESLRAAEARREAEALRETEARELAARAAAASSTGSASPSGARKLDDAYARASAAPEVEEPEERRPRRTTSTATSTPAPAPAPRTTTSKGAPLSREVLAAYEAGSVDRALALARSTNDAAAVAKLQGFKAAYDAGHRAIGQRDGIGAIRNFARALKADEAISKGWGAYGPELRGRLATLYVAAGRQRASQGDHPGAREAFRAALTYEPKNLEAKQALKVLGSE